MVPDVAITEGDKPVEQILDGLTNREAVLRILEHNRDPMRVKDIVSWPKENGQTKRLNPKTVGGVVWRLKQTGEVRVVGHGLYASVTEIGAHKPMGEERVPDLTALTGTEAVRRILAYTKKPMQYGDIVKWIEDHGQEPLTDGQIYGAFYSLSTKHPSVVEKVGRGTYGVRKDWDGKWPTKPREQLSDQSKPKKALGKEAPGEVVIPCFGLYWERSLVSWSRGKPLLGVKERKNGDGEDPVNFANQKGVYVLYLWPKVTYVGRTTGKGLFERLRDHHQKHWDRFSWFGLCPVDDDGQLGEPKGQASFSEKAMVMEGLLLSVLTPPDNKKRGDLLGPEYSQVPDPEVEERKQQETMSQMMSLLGKRLALPQGR